MQLQPSYDSTGLVNLVSEMEWRMSGDSSAPRLASDLARIIPEASTYVLVLFDGLGIEQLTHRQATPLSGSLAGTLEAGFPTTTSASLATIATGLTPSRHGVIAHLSWMPEHEKVVNTLKWVDLTGSPVRHDFAGVLPRPNLWERLRKSGIEPITVQPGDFSASPLSRVLYRGARFEGIWDSEDLIEATVQLAAEPSRFIFTYVPYVDVAGHVFGLDSPEFSEAVTLAGRIWGELQRRLPPGTALLGTADHGLVDYDETAKQLIRESRFDQVRFGGDPRGLQMWCDENVATDLEELTGGKLIDPMMLVGPDPAPETRGRLGSRLLLAPPGKVLLPRGFDKRLRAYHGGLDRREVEIPLLVG